MTDKAMKFDGTHGSAKAVAAWIGDPTKVNAAPWDHFKDGDAERGGLDLVGVDARGAPQYTTVNPGDYVVHDGSGAYLAFSAAQYELAFPAE